MKKFNLEETARLMQAEILHPAMDKADWGFSGVSIDSRSIKKGDCFFAIAGDKFDGHDYVEQAFAEGAACAVVSRNVRATLQKPILKVDGTVKALGRLAQHFRRRMNFKVAAVTGSVGKTMTRQITSHVLSRRYRTHQSPGNFNNNIGLPLTILGAGLRDEVVVVELGSSSPGEIAYLTRIAQPDVALVTNVYPAHLAGFGSIEAIVAEKLSIASGLSEEGLLLVNGDFDSLIDYCRRKKMDFTTFGRSSRCDIRATGISYAPAGGRFVVDGRQIDLPLAGRSGVENAIAAYCICSRFGITAGEFAEAVKTVPAVEMRAEIIRAGTVTIINDCYNANPASMENALDILSGLLAESCPGNIQAGPAAAPLNRRGVFICGDMAELGGSSEFFHKQLGIQIAASGARLVIAVGGYAEIAAAAAAENADYDLQILCFPDSISACNKLQNLVKDYDIILIKGSRVNQLEKTVSELKRLFKK